MRYLPILIGLPLLALTLITPALLADDAATATAPRVAASMPRPTPEDANIDEAVEKKVLADLIDKAIKLLEEKKFAETVELLSAPAMIAHVKAEGKWEQLLQRAENISEELLKSLKAAQGKEPTFERNGNTVRALYPEPEKKGDFEPGPRRLDFTRIQGQWTIK